MAESKKELTGLLMRVKEERERASLKLNVKKKKKKPDHGIQSHYFMANSREKVEVVTDFLFLGSKITADGDCSHEIRRKLLLGRKAMTTLDSILKSRGITLPTKVHIVKAVVFPVVRNGCESLTIYKEDR